MRPKVFELRHVPKPAFDPVDPAATDTFNPEEQVSAEEPRPWRTQRGPLTTLSESWYAWRAGRDLLRWYRRVQQERPDLTGRVLYEQIVSRRSGCDTETAASVVRRAEQSFCQWPAAHELRYRDVALYVIVDEYLRARQLEVGTQTDMALIIARVISEEL